MTCNILQYTQSHKPTRDPELKFTKHWLRLARRSRHETRGYTYSRQVGRITVRVHVHYPPSIKYLHEY